MYDGKVFNTRDIADDSGESKFESGGDDMVYKCACTDATILANYFCKF